MVAMHLPPVVESVRQALLMQPPAILGEIEARSSSELELYFEKHEAVVGNFEKIERAHLQQIKAGIDVLELQSDVDPALAFEHVEKLIEGAEQGLMVSMEMIGEAKVSRERLLALSTRFGIRPRMKKLTDRLAFAAIHYHNGLAHQTLRLKALAAELDPMSTVEVARASSPSDVSDFFASLRSS